MLIKFKTDNPDDLKYGAFTALNYIILLSLLQLVFHLTGLGTLAGIMNIGVISAIFLLFVHISEYYTHHKKPIPSYAFAGLAAFFFLALLGRGIIFIREFPSEYAQLITGTAILLPLLFFWEKILERIPKWAWR